MADFASALWNKPAAADSTPAEDPVTRSLRLASGSSTGDSSSHLDRNSIGTPTDGTKWTFSAWVKRSELNNDDAVFTGGTSSSDASVLRFRSEAGTEDNLFYDDNTGSTNYQWRWSPKLRDPSAFYNLMLVWDASQSAQVDKLKLYVNGVLASSASVDGGNPTSTHTMSVSNSGMNQIIGNNSSNDGKANLLIADVYFLDGVAKTVTGGVTDFTESNGYGGLKPKEYTGTDFGNNGFHIDAQPSNSADLLVSSIGRNDGDTTFVDVAAGHTITDTGDPEHSIAVGNPFTGDDRAIYFDGSGDKIETGSDADFDFGTGDFTIECWFNPSGVSGSSSVWEPLLASNNYTTNGSWVLYQQYDDIYWRGYDGGTHANLIVSSVLEANKWYHVAVTRESGTLKIYLNGEEVGSSSSFSSYDFDQSSNLRIGWSYSSYYYKGYMYDVRVVNGTAITPPSGGPTSKLEAVTNTKLLLQPDKDDSSWDDESGNQTLTGSGDLSTVAPVASTPFEAAAKSTAMYFDGNDYLQTPSDSIFAIGTSETFTAECWVYFNSNPSSGVSMGVMSAYNVSSALNWIIESRGGYWSIFDSGSGQRQTSSTAVTTGEWHHVALVKTDGNTDGARLYLNGNKIYDVTVDSNATAARKLTIGGIYASTNYVLDGYIFDARYAKGEEKYTGSTYTVPSAPLELNPVYIGGDQSGNKNHFQPTNISTTDIRTDVPTDSFCVMSPIDKGSGVTLSEGNLKAVCNNDWENVRGTMGATSGKFYFEVIGTIGSSTRWNAGIDINQKCQVETYGSNTGSIVYALYDGLIYNGTGSAGGTGNSGNSSYYETGTQDQSETNARIGVAVDIDAGKVWFRFNNGSWENSGGDPTNASANGTITFTANSLVQPLFAGYGATFTVYFQESEWTDTAPTDYGEWKTSRLGTPAVNPPDHFDILTYTGNSDPLNSGGSTQNVTGVNFDVGMAWIKDRDNKAEQGYTNSGSDEYGNYLFDTITGTWNGGYNLDYDVAGDDYALNSGYYGVSSFSAGSGTNRGIEVDEAGETNFHYDDGEGDTHTERYVAWLWKLGSTGSSSTWNGSYTAPNTEHYNDSAGVTTLEVTPVTSGDLEVAHSLSAAPEFFFVSDDSGYGNFTAFPAFHKDLSSGNYLKLDANSAQSSDSTYFPSGAAHADYIKLGTIFRDTYGGGYSLRIWAFAGVEGYSKFGKYEGNNDDDGPFVYTGFRPAFVLIKNIGASQDWFLLDNKREGYNVVDDFLEPSTSNAEATASTNKVDFIANGFKFRGSGSVTNQNNTSFVYAAFAESPFKYANAR